MASKRKCPQCKEFNPPGEFILGPGGLQAFCNFDCMVSYGSANKSKGEKVKQRIARKVKKEKLDKLKTNSEWAEEAQKAVNLYIRVRDQGKPCISCDKPDVDSRNASHFRSVGACKQLRFNTFNIHASCYRCNCEISGNLLEYRIRLVKLIGQDRVDWLECQNDIARYSVEYLQRVKKVFNRRARHLIKLRGY